MDDKLPKGWLKCKLSDISFTVTDGTHKTPKYVDKGIRFISIMNIRPFKPVNWAVYEKYITEEEHKQLVKRAKPEVGDILFPRIGTLGFAKIIDWEEEVSIFVGLGLIKPIKKFINAKYLEYYMNSPAIYDLSHQNSTGTGRMTLALEESRKLPFLLPPLAEQNRIAEKLNLLFNNLEGIRKKLDNIPQLFKSFKLAVFREAFLGNLTGNRQKTVEIVKVNPVAVENVSTFIPDSWRLVKLVDYAKLESGHTPRKSFKEYWENGNVPWISLQDIRTAHGKEIIDTTFKPNELGIKNSSARILPKGTVCFCRDISVGYTTIMGRDMATSQHFANWICGDKLLNKYLLYAFMASKNFLIASGTGTTVRTIYMPALKELYLLLPPLKEQQEIVSRIESLFEKADTIESEYKKLKEKLDTLPQAILAKAFRGELVPQDPNDEPASELLKRIKEVQSLTTKIGKLKLQSEIPFDVMVD